MRHIVWLIALIATGVYITGPLVDPDLWWHITIGRWMIAHQSIPTTDLWSMFGQGTPWRAYSWLAEVPLAYADSLSPSYGLITLKFILAALLALSFGLVFSAISRDRWVGGALGVFCTAGCHSHFTLRPQSVTWILLALLLLAADAIATEQKPLRRWLLLCFAALAVWANLHITTAIGIAIVGLWLAELAPRRTTATVVAIALLGTLCTPYFGGEWLTFFSKTDHPLQMSSIAEFQPATVMQHPTAFLILALVVCLSFAHKTPQALPRTHLILVTGLSLGALAVIKFLPIALLVTAAVIARLWRESQPANLGHLGEGLARLRTFCHKIPYEGATFLLLCTIVVNTWRVIEAPIDTVITPVAAVDFMLQKNLPPPYLNDFGRGGYLMYRLSNAAGEVAHPVAIDGRTNVTPVKIWEQAHNAFRGRTSWREFFDSVKPNTVLWPKMSPLLAILEAGSNWCVVYEDAGSEAGYAVFIKRELLRPELPSRNCPSEANPKSFDILGEAAASKTAL